MAGTIVVNFKLGGVDAVERAMRTVSQSAQRSATEQVRAHGQVEKSATQTAARAAKEKIKAERDATKEVNAMLAQGVREFEKAEKEKTKAAQREADFRLRIAKQLMREQERAAARVSSVGAGVGKAALTGAGQGFQRGTGILAAGAGLVTAGIGMSSIVGAIEKNRELAIRTAFLQNTSGFNMDYSKIARGISSKTGTDSGDVIGAFEQISGKAGAKGFAALGEDPEKFTKSFERLAVVARANKVSMTDLGANVASMVNNGVTDIDKIVAVTEAFAEQCKDGAVEFSDFAKLIDSSAGALNRYKMSASEKLITAGGLTQMAKTYGRASAAEATTSVVDIARDLSGKADLVQALTGGTVKGVKMIGGKKTNIIGGGVEVGVEGTDRAQMRNLNELLPEIIAGAAKEKNLGRLMGEGGVFTGTSTSIVAPLVQAFTVGLKKTDFGYKIVEDGEKADITGKSAVVALLKQFNDKQGDSAKTEAGFKNIMEADKFGVAMNKFQNDLGDKLAPKMGELASATAKVADGFLKLVGFVSESPAKAAAAFIGLNVALGATQGIVGKLGSNLMDKLLSKTGVMNVQATSVHVGGAVPGGTPGGTPGAGAGKMLGLAMGTAAVAGLVGGVAADKAIEDIGGKVGAETDMAELVKRAGALKIKSQKGSLDANDEKEAAEVKRELQQRIISGKSRQESSWFGRIMEGDILSNIPGTEGVARNRATMEKDDANVRNLEQMQISLQQLNQAIVGGIRVTNLNEVGTRNPTTDPMVPTGGLCPTNSMISISCGSTVQGSGEV